MNGIYADGRDEDIGGVMAGSNIRITAPNRL
jgi:hypothetical protein